MKALTTLVLGLVTLNGCNNASFSGRVPEKSATAKPAQPAQPTQTTPVNNPVTPASTPITSTTPSPSIFDRIGSLLSKLPNIDIATPNPNEIEFGSWSKVFHIGDGEMSDSSCKIGVFLYPRRGSNYFFQFEVLEDNSKVNVELGRVCGVDDGYSATNIASLTQGVNFIHRQNIMAGSSKLVMPTMTLNRGVYSVLVQSDPNPSKRNDRDDFLIGKVRIVSDKKLKAGSVGAQD